MGGVGTGFLATLRNCRWNPGWIFQDKFSGLLGGVVGVPAQLLNLKMLSGGKLDLKQMKLKL